MSSLCRSESGRRPSGFTLFELLVVCAIVGCLATLAFGRFLELQQAAEEAMVEQVIGALKSGVRIRAAQLISAARWDEFRALPRVNPFDWLEEKPENYRGELQGESPAGNWYYDKSMHAATYIVKRTGDFHAQDGSVVMRFNVVGVDSTGRSARDPGFFWLTVQPQARYVWLGRELR